MRKLFTSGAGMVLAVILAFGGVSAAGTADDPEVTDPAGDANVVSALSDEELDTRPASIDGADLRAIWLETSFVANKVLDPETGQVLRVVHSPTGLLLHFRTEAPMHPTEQDLSMFYRVRAQVRDGDGQFICSAVRFELEVPPGGTGGSVGVQRMFATCPGGMTTTAGLLAFDGDVATLSFPYTTGPFQELLPVGATISSLSEIWSFTRLEAGSQRRDTVIDEGDAAGRSFTIGQDVPPDIDCMSP